jgi:methionyl-tRNA synthetase
LSRPRRVVPTTSSTRPGRADAPPERALVTSALPYANGHVHIGHLAGAYLPADIYVRFLRAWGSDVAFICGSDEHGAPITVAAEKEGVSPKAITDRYHAADDAAFRAARVEFDIYHRTSDPRHHANSRHFFTKLDEHGYISRRETEQLFCENCRRFLPDRYVEGLCPHCGAGGARGDQCEDCGKVIDALKLADPRCKICGEKPTARKTTHWFLKLDEFAERLSEWLDGHPEWRANVRQAARGWIAEGLRERPITRDLSWGVEVPLEEAKGKVLYVWFDAPIGYLTFTQVWADSLNQPDRWKDFWRDPGSRIVHFIGKDNIPFHAIIWPAMIMGIDDGTQLPSNVVGNEYLNFGAGKFSKSAGRVIRVSEFAEAFGSNALRYYVTAVMPETSDSEFTWEDFQARYNELADCLGNFCHRGLSFAKKWLGGRLPEATDLTAPDRAGSSGRRRRPDQALLEEIRLARDEVASELRRFRFRAALNRVMDLARAGNRHFDEREPWKTRKSDLADCARAIAASLAVTRALAALLGPFLPDAAESLIRSLGEAAPATGAGSWKKVGEGELPFGAALGEPEVLFPKLRDEDFQERIGSLA